ncbi:MAG TPA: hypothetical protein VGM82_19895 [Gemmatimonadaceae bacterium]|jgi:hypothetical protein
MTTPDFDKTSRRFAAFGDRVAHLSDGEWRTLSESCASLNSTSFAALVARARLQAKPFTLPRKMRDAMPLTRIMNGALQLYANGLWFAHEFGREFEPELGAERWASAPRPTDDPRMDRCVGATFEIEQAIAPRIASEPGVAAALRAASHAIMNHYTLGDNDFRTIYAYVEPVIPYASLSPEI